MLVYFIEYGLFVSYTSITKISVPLNELNLVKNILSCGVIHKGNFLTCKNDILLDVRKLPLWMTPQLKIFFTKFSSFNGSFMYFR